jgi:hypothetical protein
VKLAGKMPALPGVTPTGHPVHSVNPVKKPFKPVLVKGFISHWGLFNLKPAVGMDEIAQIVGAERDWKNRRRTRSGPSRLLQGLYAQ